MKNFLLAFRLTSMITEIPTLEKRIGFPLPASSSCVGIREPHKRCLSVSKWWHRVLDKVWCRLLVKRCRGRYVTYLLLLPPPPLFFFFFFFWSLNLLIGWQISIWNCRKPFFSLLYNCQLLCFRRLALSVVVEVFPRPFFRILLLQGRLLQNRYTQLYALSMRGVYFFKFLKVTYQLLKNVK